MVEDRHTLEYCDLTHLKPMLNTSWFKTYVWKNITPEGIFNNLCFKVRSSHAPEKIIGPLVQLQFQYRRQLEGENQFWQRRAVQNRTQMSKHQPTKVGLQSEDYSIYFLNKNNTGNRLYFLKVDRFLFCLS